MDSSGVLLTIYEHYADTRRKYHTLDHICYMFRMADELNMQLSKEQILAIWFHDVVYEVHADKYVVTNEQKSAKMAFDYLKQIPGVDESIVSQIILDTQTHDPTIEESVPVLDLDLIILASSFNKYFNVYVYQLVEEFKNFGVDIQMFKKGRTEWLKSFIAKDKIFSDNIPGILHRRAKTNLKYELKFEWGSYE